MDNSNGTWVVHGANGRHPTLMANKHRIQTPHWDTTGLRY